MDFKHSYPNLASFLSKHATITRKDQQQSRWHWLTLILFGLLTIATFPQQLLLLVVFTLIVALIKGPGMILWGMVYAFLVSLFPPIAIFLSAFFFLLNIGTFAKNWRLSLAGSFFYFYPATIMLLRYFWGLNNYWFLTFSLLTGLVLLHFILTKLYQGYGIGRTIFWYIFALPFTFLSVLLPSRVKRKIKRFPIQK